MNQREDQKVPQSARNYRQQATILESNANQNQARSRSPTSKTSKFIGFFKGIFKRNDR